MNNELLRFHISVAVWVAKKQTDDVKSHHCSSLVHIDAGTLDCNISSMNGLKQTHSLAIMVLQHDQSDTGPLDLEIIRLKNKI